MSPSKPQSESALARHADRREPASIGPLAVLPVFLSLHGRAALVIGDSPAAAWKAELLAAAGARVSVVAADAWHERDLAGCAIAVADLEEAEALRFAAAARRAGVPHNVIDKPGCCSFQFGAVVNRSPVVIGISTDGAAPVLGQAIRRRVEMLLPSGLAAWAAAAKSLRAVLKQRLPCAARRRAFWNDVAEIAFTEAPGADPLARLHRLAGRHGSCKGGLPGVTLVGAGPGDAGLLTLNALRALQSADVILFDVQVSGEVLELARREAKRLPVGGWGRQEDVDGLMIALARQGKRVVRLMAGDPMLFGRASGEIAGLKRAGIAVSVVPGVTAAAETRPLALPLSA